MDAKRRPGLLPVPRDCLVQIRDRAEFCALGLGEFLLEFEHFKGRARPGDQPRFASVETLLCQTTRLRRGGHLLLRRDHRPVRIVHLDDDDLLELLEQQFFGALTTKISIQSDSGN